MKFSSVSFDRFEQVNANWVIPQITIDFST